MTLEHCPFCGSFGCALSVKHLQGGDQPKAFAVVCTPCGAVGPRVEYDGNSRWGKDAMALEHYRGLAKLSWNERNNQLKEG